MIEVNKTYNLLPGIDQQAYLEYGKGAFAMMLQAPGIVEIRVYRSLLGSPQVRLTLLWETLADWAKFAESSERQKLDSELFEFASDIGVELWGPSLLCQSLSVPAGKSVGSSRKAVMAFL
jgi:hypothetical protein